MEVATDATDMGKPGPAPAVRLDAVLEVFDRRSDHAEPLTASEVAAELDCTRRTAHKKLEQLTERGSLASKKPGARSRVWWRPTDSHDGTDSGSRDLTAAQFEEFADQVTEYAIFVLDETGHIETWNEGAERIKGYSEDEILGRHLRTFYTERDRENDVPERNIRAAAELGVVEDEGWRVRQDDTRFWANITLTRLTNDEGDLEGYIKVTRDMTDRHARELALQREKERFESLVTEVKDYAIFMLDPDGTVTSWNQGAANIKGYDEADIVGEHFSTFYTEEERDAGVPERNLQRAIEEGRVEDEGWRLRQDGTRFWANVVITRLTNEDGSTRGFAKVTRDMTERRQYEQQLKHQRDELRELDRINAVIREVDHALVNAESRDDLEGAVCDRLVDSEPYVGAWMGGLDGAVDRVQKYATAGFDPGGLDTTDGTPSDAPEFDVARRALDRDEVQVVAFDETEDRFAHWTSAEGETPGAVAAVPLRAGDIEYGVLEVYAIDPGTFDDRKRDVLAQLGRTIGDTLAALRRKERERRLTALHRATRDLVDAETEPELGEAVVATVTDVLEFHAANVYRFDTADNTLKPLASAVRDGETTYQPPVVSAQDDSAVWSAFVDGDTHSLESRASRIPEAGAAPERTELLVPIAEHGVIVAVADPEHEVDADDRHLVDLVAATTEAAFDRLESDANLRKRDAILQEQNQRLQRLDRVNTLIREVDQALVRATTTEEIYDVVCERLTATDRFRYAWFGQTLDDAGSLEPAASAGQETDYLDVVSLDADADEPAVVAARTGSVQVVENVATDLRVAPWRSEAFARELQSCIAVPLTYGDVTYGVLAVYGDGPGTFGDIEESVFEELGTTIGNAIHAVETKHALLSNRSVEVEFGLSPETDTVLTALAERTEVELAYDGAIPLGDAGRVRLYVTAWIDRTDRLLDAVSAVPGVEAATIVTEGDGQVRVEIELDSASLPARLAEQSASLVEYTVDDSGGTVVVDVPGGSDVGEFINWFLETYPGATFVARRETDRDTGGLAAVRTDLPELLTDRQYEVLKTAYLSGFFETPRERSGRDIAESLDVSQPTVTAHLRAGQRRLFDELFER